MLDKLDVSNLALFSGKKIFERYLSTSNLVRPAFDQFMDYSHMFYKQRRYTNNGPLVKQLEQRLAEFHHVDHCITFSSGFWGLVLAIKALALSEKTEVIVPSFTYRRMADVVAWAGFTPHFCDVDPQTLAISASTAVEAINADTALILCVHPIVNTCDVHALLKLAESFQLPILFDSVESVFETYLGKKVGSFGNAECFSMHASKFINGFEGGYVTTNDPVLARKLALMRGFGFYGQDNIEEFGTNAKLNEIHAAMALASLDGLDEQVEHNRTIYRTYQRTLESISGIRLLTFDEGERTGFKNIVVELLDEWPLSREETIAVLHSERILARAYYSPPLHQKKYTYPTKSTEMSATNRLAERFMTLPCGYLVDESDVELVVDLLKIMRIHAYDIRRRLQL
ncbi:DegT/DnrJ/EryC1/StrS family aminotransferase [Alicyclobacillus tolerans]|uniref:DegT/DnrJ/EryC1/StrS family aminotransferase n=1 Tax=Alicyclobacillus tolerans TaxID=90970 RepID=UPI001F396A26|nr:aminotransferase class I/II-fold pyridoxal phosphate-dependent enzyme [Alicyclobacillus tolerans]MCF8567765.1 DegT/DnrJ/EryC1/StrS family aminotransferase [Alicyclobacillus tolerans]